MDSVFHAKFLLLLCCICLKGTVNAETKLQIIATYDASIYTVALRVCNIGDTAYMAFPRTMNGEDGSVKFFVADDTLYVYPVRDQRFVVKPKGSVDSCDYAQLCVDLPVDSCLNELSLKVDNTSIRAVVIRCYHATQDLVIPIGKTVILGKQRVDEIFIGGLPDK